VLVVFGLVGLGAWNIGREAWNFDPTVYPYSKDQVQAMLVDAKTTLPRRDGGGKIDIWGAGRSAKGVKLNMKYASWAPLLECEAIVTAVAPKESRVVADCGKSPNSDSAMSRTQDSLRSPMFEEHIVATLQKAPIQSRDRRHEGSRGRVQEPRRNAARSVADERRRGSASCGAQPLSGSDVRRVKRLASDDAAAELPDGDAKLPSFASEVVVDAEPGRARRAQYGWRAAFTVSTSKPFEARLETRDGKERLR